MRLKKKHFQFGQFRLYPTEQLLLREETAIPLAPKTFDILLILVKNSGHLVTREDLMSAVWPDSFVEETNLTVNISLLRKALGDMADGRPYIETVPRKGYRFNAEVQDRDDSDDSSGEVQIVGQLRPATPLPLSYGEPAQADTRPLMRIPAILKPPVDDRPLANPRISRHMSLEPPLHPRRFKAIFLSLLTIVLVAAGVVFYLLKKSNDKLPSNKPRALAILPFRNLKQDPSTDFLGFSLADAVISKIGYISALTVRPSSSVEKYRNQQIDPQKVAAALNVDTLLTGSFLKDGDDLRITTQLIDAKPDRVIWQDTIDLKYEKLLSVQDRVAQQIIKGLELRLSPAEAEHLKPDQEINPSAYEYYLRGVDAYGLNDFPLAIKLLEQSAGMEPNYALTWAHLGRSYTTNASLQFGGLEQYRKAQAAYEKALALNPALIEPRIYMANLFTDTGRVEEAVPLLRAALETNPNNAEAHWELGYAYRFGGMLPESVAEGEEARSLDPEVKMNSSALNSYFYMGEYDKFIQSLPANDSVYILFYRGFGEYYKKDFIEAQTYFDRAFGLDPSLLQAQVGKALSEGIAHDDQKGLALLRQTERMIADRGVSDAEGIYKVAQAYAVLGDKASALRVLRQAIQGGFFPQPYFVNDPLLNSIRREPECDVLLDQARQRHEQFKNRFFSGH
jgi:DNA-binding winged helix-turn-helix (wHTH) protein/TolB-like protein